MLLKEIQALIAKDFRYEMRRRYAINGILLYVVSIVFISYLSFLHVAGAARLGVASSITGSLIFNNSANAYAVIIQSSDATTADYTLTLPAFQATTTTFLKNDGAGNHNTATGSRSPWNNIL